MTLRTFPTVAFLLTSFLAPASSYATLIVNFDFDETSGTPLVGGVASSVGGYTWTATAAHSLLLTGIVTDGSGNLSVSYSNQNVSDAAITLAAADQILAAQNSHVQLELEVAPWSFSAHSGRNEQLRFGIGNSSPTNVFADVLLTRVGPGQVTVQARALGTGAVEGAEVTLPFGDVSSDPVTFVLDINKLVNQYSLSYKVGSGPLTPVTDNTGLSLDSGRNGNFLRLGFDETFSDDTFAISRFTVTAVPESTTIVPMALALLACAGRRKKKIVHRLTADSAA